jgi:hypothetical protein
MQRHRATLMLLAALAACVTAANTAAAEAANSSRRALLIGINEYQEEKISDLNGAINDIERLAHVLRVRFGFPESNILMLKDRQATRENVLTALRTFVDETTANDVVYIHFSGHGSQAPDKNGDEPDDRLDETIVPHDGRAEGIPDITDDELEEIFAELKTDNALIVLDSCHSGTGTRSVSIQTRSIPADHRDVLYQSESTRGAPVTTTVSEFDYVLMTGAAADQNALDGPIDDKFYGVFSYALAKTLDTGPGATPAALIAGVGEEFLRIEQVWGGAQLPDPQLEGKAFRLGSALYPLLANPDPARPLANQTFLEVEPGSPGNVILIDGNRLGAAAGSIWGVFPSDAADFSSGALATARVTGMRGNDAVAELDRDVEIPPEARAVEIIPGSLSGPITIDLRAPAGRREALIAQIELLLDGTEFVPRNYSAQFIVDVVADQVSVYGATGLDAHDRFEWTNAESAARRLAASLSRSHAAAEIVALANHSSKIRLHVDVVGSDAAVRGVGVAGAARKARYRMRGIGEARNNGNSLMLEVRSSVDAYITIAAVNAEGSVNVLFPNDYQNESFLPDGRIPADRTLRIPDSYAEGNRAGFHWDIVPPAGHDVIQVFAATDEETARQIRRYIAELAEETRTRRMPGTRSAGRGQAAAQMRTLRGQLGNRGIGLVQSDDGQYDAPGETEVRTDWTVSAVRIEVLGHEPLE